MNLTTRSCSPRGARRRWEAGHLHFWSTAARTVLVAASILAAGGSALADGDTLGTNNFFLGSGSGHLQGSFVGSANGNNVVGAPRFYNAGYTGTNAVIANIEAGYVWSGHEALSHVTMIPTSSGAAGEVDRHATWVSMVLGGRPGGANPGDYQRGLAPNAQLASGAIATNWPSSLTRYTGSFNFNFN